MTMPLTDDALDREVRGFLDWQAADVAAAPSAAEVATAIFHRTNRAPSPSRRAVVRPLIVLALLAALVVAGLVVGGRPRTPVNGPIEVGTTLQLIDPTTGKPVAATCAGPCSGFNDPDWSPDGRQLVYVRPAPPDPGLYVTALDGTPPSRIATCSRPDCAITKPVWSPDGKRILYTEGYGDVFIVDADGQGGRRLPIGDHFSTGITWDGPDRLLYTTAGDLDAGHDVRSVSLDGSDERTLVSGVGIVDAAISPDGRQIAWLVGASGTDPAGYRSQLWVRPIEGGDARLLLTVPHCCRGGGWIYGPEWAPDSRLLAVVGMAQDGLQVVDIATGAIVTSHDGANARPAWRPLP